MTEEQNEKRSFYATPILFRDLKYALHVLFKKSLFDGLITTDEFNQLCGD